MRLIGTPPWKSRTGSLKTESCMSRAIRPDHHWGWAVTHNFTRRFSLHCFQGFSSYSLTVKIQQEVIIFLPELFGNETKPALWADICCHFSHRYHRFVWAGSLQDFTFSLYFSSIDVLRFQCLICFSSFYADSMF